MLTLVIGWRMAGLDLAPPWVGRVTVTCVVSVAITDSTDPFVTG